MKRYFPAVSSCIWALFACACARHNAPAESSMNSAATNRARHESTESRPTPNDNATLTPASGPAINQAEARNTANPGPATSRTDDANASNTAKETAEASDRSTDSASSVTDTPARSPDVVFVPTPQAVVDKMLQIARVSKNDVVYDLGCGDGRIVVTAAKRYGARAYGFDIDPKRIAEARENVRKSGVGHLVTINQADIFTLDLRPATVVTLYLLPRLNVKLIPQLERLNPGSRIVSHDFDMEGVTPAQHLDVNAEDRNHGVYLWTTPLKRESGVMRSSIY